MATTPTTPPDRVVNSIVTAGARAVGNGTFVFGFITNTDPGLDSSEFVVIPHGVTGKAFATRAATDDDTDYSTNYVECLFTDAEAVNNMGIVDALKPFIAANRAASYAAGYLSPGMSDSDTTGCEVKNHPNVLADADKSAIAASCPHLAKASAMNAQTGTIALFCSAINFFQSNHNTTGVKLPKGQIKAIRATTGVDTSIDDKAITRAVYLAAHATDKRLILRCIISTTLANSLRQPRVFINTYLARGDQWARLRTGSELLPAGTAILGLLKVVLKKVADCGLLGFAPAPEAVTALTQAYNDVSSNAAAYHPGAKFLFDVDVTVLSDVEDLKTYLGVFGGFCAAANMAPTVTSVPHVAALIGERARNDWTNMGREFARGVTISMEAAVAAANAYSVGMGASVTDPVTDVEAYKAETDAIITALKDLKL